MRTLPLLALLLPACLPALPGDPPKPGGSGDSGVTDTGRDDTGAADTGARGTAPEILGLTLTPEQPRVTDALVVYANVLDMDGDLTVVAAMWTVNGLEVPDGTVVADAVGTDGRTWSAAFPGMDFAARGDAIGVELFATDDEGNLSEPTSVITRVINSEPVAPTPAVYPEAPDQDTELSCLALEPTDADGDTLATTFAWYADNAPLSGQEGVTLAAGTVPHGTYVSCMTSVSDGAGGIVYATSPSVLVVDRMPTIGSVTLEPGTPGAYRPGDPLLCLPSDVEDLDGDDIVAEYTFTAGGQSVSITGDENGREMPWALFPDVHRGDTVRCTVELYADGLPVAEATSDPVTVANTPPVAEELRIATQDGGAWRVGSYVDCEVSGLSDLDGDDVAATTDCYCGVTDAYGVLRSFDPDIEGIPEAGSLSCYADPFDGLDAGNRVTDSAVVTWAPFVNNVRFEPAPITATSGLWLAYDVVDPDSANVDVSIYWYHKAPTASGWTRVQRGTDATLGYGLHRGDQVYAVLSTSDAEGPGATFTTNPVTVLDSPTPVASVTLTQDTTTSSASALPDLRCHAEATDVDGDALSLHVAWEREGQALAANDPAVTTTVHAGAQAYADSIVSGSATAAGESWTCKVWTTNNGTLTTDPTVDPVGWTGPGEASLDLPHAAGEQVFLADLPFRWLPAGGFTMGCTETSCGTFETPAHTVTRTRDTWISETEVTQHAFEALLQRNPSLFGPGNADAACADTKACPVDRVSWHDAAQYANALSASEGLPGCYACDPRDGTCAVIGDPYDCDGYRLPTEAEWEAAARCGSDSPYAGADSYVPDAGPVSTPGSVFGVAWFGDNAYGRPHDVAAKDANGCGLHDMSGNLREWTSDVPTSYGTGDVTDPYHTGGSTRAVRGGSWDSPSVVIGSGATLGHVVPELFVWARASYDATQQGGDIGFRLARSVPRSVQYPSANTLPSLSTVQLDPSTTAVGETLRCRPVASDPDDDTIRYGFLWLVREPTGEVHAPAVQPVTERYVDNSGNVVVQSVLPGQDATGAPATAQGQVVTCQVWATDDPTRGVPQDASVVAAGWSSPMTAQTTIVGPGDVVTLGPMTFAWIAPAAIPYTDSAPFLMGYDTVSSGHAVTLTRDFAMATTEVTQEDFLTVMGYNPAYHGPNGTMQTCTSGDCPVETVSWHQAAAFANAYSRYLQEDIDEARLCYTCTGEGNAVNCTQNAALASIYDCDAWRLPTEAEWEMAATCGAYTAHAGSVDALYVAHLAGVRPETPDHAPIRVGQLAMNACELHDMSGNVWEWVNDWHATVPTVATVDPIGGTGGTQRVLRGEGYSNAASDYSRTTRSSMNPGSAAPYVGFRLARSIPR